MKTLILSCAVLCSAMVGALPVSVTSVPQGTDPKGPNGWWAKRHLERLALATNMPEVVFLGDSITHFWRARVILTSIFPRGKTREDPARKLNDVVNRELPELADGKRVIWCDFTDRFLAPNGDRVRWLDFNDKLLGPDGGVARQWAFCTVLASADVYKLWRKELEPVLTDYLIRS